MLESLTIFSKGGLILYQYSAIPSVMDNNNQDQSSSSLFTLNCLNQKLIPKVFLSNTSSSGSSAPTVSTATLQSRHWIDGNGAAYVWLENATNDLYAVAIYPDIVFEGPRLYLQQWAKVLVASTLQEYNLFYQSVMEEENKNSAADGGRLVRPDPALFDATFQVLLEQAKTARPDASASAASTTITKTNAPKDHSQNADSSNPIKTSSNKAGGKEKRNWHDGSSRVTDKAMAELDFSKVNSSASGDEDQAAAKLAAQERALQEARAAYLPTDKDLAEAALAAAAASVQSTFNDDDTDASSSSSSSSWSASAMGLLQQLTGNKILQASDLESPLQQIQQMLVRNNVAQDMADELCSAIRQKLLGKRLKSLARVQTAVRQALEASLEQILRPSTQVDLMQNVVRQRGDYSSSSLRLFNKSNNNNNKRRPYVIAVIGINGVGKSTSLAKLAYYFCQHDCHPMLVAGDTFRSGAVEQLQVHAKCLNVPMFSRGYSKDPSVVVKAAIAHASSSTNPSTANSSNDGMDDGEDDQANWKKHDVVLCDTAGRMQNNVPLMNALGKLVQENQPDFVLLVVEALVGHDGLNQFTMFQNALLSKSGRGIDGLILTKFDTVSDKVGAALTLTRQTGVPIVFIGTGQKYHHLQKLSAPSVINSLFS